jgi:hypothetical protein
MTKTNSGPAVPGHTSTERRFRRRRTNLAPGQYQYVFATKAPSGFDVTATHTIGIYASRDLTVYNLGTNFASATFSFVPNGAKVTKTHDLIKTATATPVTISWPSTAEGAAASICAHFATPTSWWIPARGPRSL